MEEQSMIQKLKMYFPIMILACLLIMGMMNIDRLLNYGIRLLSIVAPLLVGVVMAYVLNILVVKFEKIYFPNSKSPWVGRSRRGVCILLSFVSIVGIIYLVLALVIPQLVSTVRVLIGYFPQYYNKVMTWLESYAGEVPMLENLLNQIDFQSGREVLQKILTVAGAWTGNVVTIVKKVFSAVVDIIIAFIFAMYILTGKERLQGQLNRLFRTYLPIPFVDRLYYVFKTAHNTFTSYVVGQCIEAVILGLLCTLGMMIFKFPYAAMIGSVVGMTALIPMVGAYIGAGIGAFMVLTVSPIKMIFFLIFIIILQQLENNLIYPRVVGTSVGLPGIWVLTAVTIGGGLFGVIGILFSVPVAATLYQLLKNDIRQRQK